jgi:cytochrome oxidase Cu insertion factor (SCO1/SenC/PrrC family)
MHSLRTRLLCLLATALLAGPVSAQGGKEDPEWVKQSPTIGDPLPDLTVYTADGKEFKTSSLRGHYTVLDFGCLT